MLQVLGGNSLRFCDRIPRRELLEIGGLGMLGLGLPQFLRARAHGNPSTDSAANRFGRAKRVVFLYMWGGAAHQDTWDPKPDAPLESRGEFLPIGTNVPGVYISEHFPLLAQQAAKLAIVRSVSQEDNTHGTGAHGSLTGRKHELRVEDFGARPTDFPNYGSVLSRLRPGGDSLPAFVQLPHVITVTNTTNGPVLPGQGAGFLGKRHDPFLLAGHPDSPEPSVSALQLPPGTSIGRVAARNALLAQLDQVAGLREQSAQADLMDGFYRQAFDMVSSPQVRKAFDLNLLGDDERWRYGWHTFGQSVLLARRLIEAGVQLVTVYWYREKSGIDSTWDTHSANFHELKSRLMPAVDRPIAALLEDLSHNGLLDETLVVWNSEFGRTPKINENAGRDHWATCNSVVLAGGGMPGGQVFGASDRQAAFPVRDKVTQDDVAATIYHLLGIDPGMTIYDQWNVPHLLTLGRPIAALLGGAAQPQESLTTRLRKKPAEISPFTRMLMERGRRYIACNLGNPDSEQDWELTGWSPPAGAGLNRRRVAVDETAALRFRGKISDVIKYGVVALRFEKPRAIDRLKLSINDHVVPVPAELAGGPPRQVWQWPLPEPLTNTLSALHARIHAPGWGVTDFAILGDEIDERHLARVGA